MDRPRSYRFLRIAVSVIFGLLCFVFAELGARSYRWETIVQGVIGTERIQIGTASGVMEVYITPNVQSRNFPNTSWSRHSRAISSFESHRIVWQLHRLKPNGINIAVPHWFLIVITAAIAAAPWLRRQFSLRTLLIATTLIAVLLGIVVATWPQSGREASVVPSAGIENLLSLMPFLILAVPLSLLGSFVLFAIYMAASMILDRRRSRKK